MTDAQQGAAGRRPRVAVAVVTYDSAAVLEGCLDSLPDAFGDDAEYEVVVADNASADDSVALTRRLRPDATVVEMGGNRGYAAGINAAADAAGSFDALLVLNPDVRLEPASIRPLLSALERPGAGIAVPRILDAGGNLVHSLRRDPTVMRALGEAVLGGRRAGRRGALGEVVRDARSYGVAADHDWASGAAMLVGAECLRTTGSWDESFFLYSEECDFAWRARDRGFGLRYVPDAVAVHLGGESGVSAELWRLLTLNRVRAFRRRHGRLHAAAFWLAVVVNEALRSGRGPTHRAALAALLRPWRRPLPEGAELGARAGPPPDEGPGYVCFSAHDWWYHSHAHSDFQLMTRVARHRRVLFVNSITLRMPRPGRTPMFSAKVLRKLRSLAHFVRRPVPGLRSFWVMTPVFVPAYGSERVRSWNARLVALQVSIVARLVGIRRPVCVVTVPTAWDVTRHLESRCVVANRVDRYSAFEEADQRVVADLERALVAGADRVAYASRALMTDEAEVAGDRAFFLDHGVDLDLFVPRAPTEIPSDLAAIPEPRVGFFGTLREYTVDLDLLERVARDLPETQLVLVGPAQCPIDRLTALPNVHWLGPRPYGEIPAYGSGFDVALMPWLDNEWIRYANPIKLKEYLALGLPVVSTDFPEVRRYREWIRVAADHAEFVELVRRTVDDGGLATADERRGAVSGASWTARATQLMSAAEESLSD